MKRVKFVIQVPFAGCGTIEGEEEYEDDVTDEELDKDLVQFVCEQIDHWREEVE